MYYSCSIILNRSIGNNTFVYDERVNLFGKAQIIVPQLIEWTLDDVQPGDNIVFAEMIDGELQKFMGLDSLVCIDNDSQEGPVWKKVYVMDNHNHALYCWYREHLAWRIEKWLSLVHIDQHSDMNDPAGWIDGAKENDLEYIAQYVNEICTIADFIQPALAVGLISECLQVRTEYGLLDYKLSLPAYILDIDIDFWAPEMGIEEFGRTIQKTRELIAGASVVTIATSPCFMEQNRAVEIVKLLVS